MGLFGFLKSSEKALDAAADIIPKAADGIDKLFFTSEEKSEAALKAFDLWIKTQSVIRDETTARSITRRILAIMIMGTFLLMGLGACVVYPFNVVWASQIILVMKELGVMTAAVSIFYFGYYGVKAIVGGKK